MEVLTSHSSDTRGGTAWYPPSWSPPKKGPALIGLKVNKSSQTWLKKLPSTLRWALPAICLTAFSPIKLGNCSSKINCSAICSSHGVVRNSHHFYFIKSNEEGSYRIFVEFYDFHIMDPSKCSIRRFILFFNDSLIHMSVIAHHNLYSFLYYDIWFIIKSKCLQEYFYVCTKWNQ